MIINPYHFPSLKYFGNIIENISPSLYEHLLSYHTLIKDKLYLNPMRSHLTTYTQFEEVCIETINRCNGSCSFCPVNKNIDPRPYHLMSDKLFYRIINQLRAIGYEKTISLFCNNEALLDKRIFAFLEYARKSLPKAFICINTNGILLTPEKLNVLLPNLNLLIINNYNNTLTLNPNIIPIHELTKSNPNVWITLRKQTEILNSRSGQAKNRTHIPTISSPCIYPFMQLSIRSSGLVNLCCNDALGMETLGDTNTQSLTEIWNSYNYVELRKIHLQNRQFHPICKSCDTITIPKGVSIWKKPQ